jgi:hypothetical protein
MLFKYIYIIIGRTRPTRPSFCKINVGAPLEQKSSWTREKVTRLFWFLQTIEGRFCPIFRYIFPCSKKIISTFFQKSVDGLKKKCYIISYDFQNLRNDRDLLGI